MDTQFKYNSNRFDDENTSNQNGAGGSLPDGTYNADTTLQYCSYSPVSCLI